MRTEVTKKIIELGVTPLITVFSGTKMVHSYRPMSDSNNTISIEIIERIND
jgi:hypothetical protein